MGRGVPLPQVLRNQYLIENDDELKDLLLSPRAHRRGDTFMSCTCCANNIKRSSSVKPPGFGISNGWVIGYIPKSIVGEIDDLLASMISQFRFFSYIFSYIAGAHKSIKGHHTFFYNDPEHIGATLNYLRDSGSKKDVYVMLCGRMTPSQREIAKKKCKMDSEKYMTLLKWLIANHPSYKDITPPEEAPHPVPLGGFVETQNNTDESDPSSEKVEKSFEGSRFTFAPANQPTENTGSFTNEKDFIFSLLQEKEPTLIFHGGDRVGSHNIKLEEMFPVQFPFGIGGLGKRPTRVRPHEVLRHFARLSLPQFHRADFILVIYAMYQRAKSFQNSILTCRSSLDSTTLGEKLSTVTEEEIEAVTTQVLDGRGNKTTNATMNKLFHSISANCKSVGHSNEAAAVARRKTFATWQYFGAPAVFATASPCDENSLRVRLYATSETHKLPSLDDIMDEESCFLDLNLRKRYRATFPGACSLEYQSLMQVFINVLIGWDRKNMCGKNGIFGKTLAWTKASEEQMRLTLHGHLIIWIERFNKLRDLLFHSDMQVRIEARKQIVQYFEKIGQATLGDLIVTVPDGYGNTVASSPNTSLEAPSDQALREMRHHVYCKEHNGAVGYHVPSIQPSMPTRPITPLTRPVVSPIATPVTPTHSPQGSRPVSPLVTSSFNQPFIQPISPPVTATANVPVTRPNLEQASVSGTSTGTATDTIPATTPATAPITTPATTTTPKAYSASDLIKSNTAYCLPCNLPQQSFTDAQIDRLAYMMPYHMKQNPNMRPADCRGPTTMNQAQTPLQKALLSYQLRHPLLQLRYNIHDSDHRKSCFKKGCECRFELPSKVQECADILFASDKEAIWFYVDGSTKKVCAFKYMTKRNIGDQFMNQHNDIATLVLACNTNVNSADRSAFYYITYYQMKHNQTEEKLAYLAVCEGLSRRIRYQMKQMTENPDAEMDPRDLNRPDSSEGLKRVLSAMYAHTSGLVVSAPMAHLLLCEGERFEFSHGHDSISLPHLIDWFNENMDKLFFVLRSTKLDDGKTIKVPDYFINDVLYRPQELEKMCLYAVKLWYEKVRIPPKKKKQSGVLVDDGDDNAGRERESNTRFFFFEEHPASKIMCIKKKDHLEIPQISSTKLFPNVSELEMNNFNPSDAVIKVREEYAQMALLLFYPFRTRSDLKEDGSFWKKYRSSVRDKTFWPKGLEILQNIQDITYNCTQLTRPVDPVTASTMLKEHEKDKELNRSNNNEENTVTIENIEALLKSVDGHDDQISDPDIHKRRLKLIAEKVVVPPHTIASGASPTIMKDILKIPREIKDIFRGNDDDSMDGDDDLLDLSYRSTYLQNNPLVIEMITGRIFTPFNEANWDNEDPYSPDSLASKINLKYIITANTLDIKQAAAFEILACSYLLTCLDEFKVTEDEISKLFSFHDYNRADKTKKLKELKDMLVRKGGTTELVMFLSGMGGSGKSTVIKAFHKFARHISIFLNWPFNENTVKITALTGSAASLLDDANTLHMTACLNKAKVTDVDQAKWVGTKMLFIDEVSFMTSDNLNNLDKKLRHLTQKSNVLFGGVGIIFVGDFHQMQPVKGSPLYKVNNVQFRAINRAVFLNRSHRFKEDKVFGEILRRFRNGTISEDDILFINSRYIEEDNVTLPENSKLRFACSTNEERNAISTSAFLQHLQATHTVSDDPSTDCPNHTVIIKGTLRYGRRTTGMISRNLRNMIYDTCGDADVENSEGKRAEPVLKFYHNVPLMMNSNDRIDENLANGTPCIGLYISLKRGVQLEKENWEGFMVNTVQACNVRYMICKREKEKETDPDEYFKIEPKKSGITISCRYLGNLPIKGINMTQFGVIDNIATTGHKLQGMSLDNLVVNSWFYGCPNWVYVILSRVRKLAGLVLNIPLDAKKDYSPKPELTRWEEDIRERVERPLFEQRGELEAYLEDERMYA